MNLKKTLCGITLTLGATANAQTTVFSNPNYEPGRGVATLAPGIPYLKAPGCMNYDSVEPTSRSQVFLSIRSLKSVQDYSRTVTNKMGFQVSEVVDKVKTFALNGSHKNIKKAIQHSTTSVGEITIRKEFDYINVRNPKPSPFLAQLADSADPYELYKYCGDSYVHGFKPVIETVGHIICKTNSHTNKMNLDSALDGFGTSEGIRFGGDISRQVDEEVKAYAESCQISFFSLGGGGRSLEVDSVANFISSTLAYTLAADSHHAWIESIEAVPYSQVLDPEVRNLLQGQQIAFPRAKELVAPIASSTLRVVQNILMSQQSHPSMAGLEEQQVVMASCVETPWEADTTCVIDDGQSIPFPFD